jgi:hypothetical protein
MSSNETTTNTLGLNSNLNTGGGGQNGMMTGGSFVAANNSRA